MAPYNSTVGTLQELTDYCEHLESYDGTLHQVVSTFTSTDSYLISLRKQLSPNISQALWDDLSRLKYTIFQ